VKTPLRDRTVMRRKHFPRRPRFTRSRA
jgi:hypothetical protein